MSKLKAIVLAAGGSTRFGRLKQSLCWQNKSLLRHAVDKCLTNNLDVTLVLGAQAENLSLEFPTVHKIINPRWQQGIGHSISLAAQKLGPEDSAVLIFLADHVAIQNSDIDDLIKAWRANPASICCAQYLCATDITLFGPPVIFPQRFFESLKHLKGDVGAKKIIILEKSKPDANITWVTMPNAGFDIDTEDDWQQWCAMQQPQMEDQ